MRWKRSSRAECMASRFDAEFSAYRIAREGLPIFDGGGAFRWGGRWTSPGRYVIHAAESYSLALLENLVHFNLGEMPPHFAVAPFQIPKDVSREIADATKIGQWNAPSPFSASRQYGDAWYDQRRTAVLIVPSVISPFEFNILINQEHPDTRQILVGDPVRALLDDRLRALLTGTTARQS